MQKNTISITLLLCLLPFNFSFAASAQTTPQLSAEFDEVQKSLLRKHGLTSEQIAFSLYDIEAHKPLELSRAQELMTMASVSKIFTVLYTLNSLRESDRPLTTLAFNGEKKSDGTWKGDLILRGGGDPTLDIPELMDAVLTLKNAGLKKLDGNFYYDDSLFPALGSLSPIGWEDQTYNPGISALSSHFNRFHVYGSDSTPLPPLEGLTLSKSEEALPNELQALASSGLAWTLAPSWSLKRNQERDLPVRSPSLFTAEFLRSTAKMLGILLPKAQQASSKIKAPIIWNHRGLTFMRLAELTMEYSNNLLAETLLLHASVAQRVATLDLKSAGAGLKSWMLKKYQNEKLKLKDELELVNGSGITSDNKVTALALTEILAQEFKGPSTNPPLISLLSVGGHSGWISDRFKDPKERYRVWAKTGSLDFVSNIAGYLITNQAQPRVLAFSFFVIDGPKRKVLDLGTTPEGVALSKGARDFRNRATLLTEEWLSHWMTKY